ncbi:MAG: hypothetical protein ACOZCO_05170 [Bacteroidota bacterium]
MIAKEKRKIHSGAEVDHLFPKPKGEDKLIKSGATVEDTVDFIPKVVEETLNDTREIANRLKGETLFDSCKNIWQFVYGHIAYEKDEKGKEQIRRPARSWADRLRGVDCDDYTVFISSVLTHLGIPHSLRIAKYWWSEDKFAHIYPVVHTEDGKQITVDCVVNRFNYEEPFTEKRDKKMDLYYLNGIERPTTVDAVDLTDGGLAELGKVKILQKIGQGVKKVVHAVNKVNPATALLRAGVLASMKLNVFKVAENVRFAYLSDEEAKKRKFDMARFAKMKEVKTKLEKIFYGAGGQPENLKEAILTGKGNASKEVSGLMGNETEMPLRDVLGQRIFTNEIESLEGLGEPATGAALAAASAIMASLAAIIKNIGGLKGGEANVTTDATANVNVTDPTASVNMENLNLDQFNIPEEGATDTPSTEVQKRSTTITDTDDVSNTNKSADGTGDQPTGWDKHKKWVIPTAIGVGVLGLGFAAYKVSQNKDKTAKKGKKSGEALAGINQGGYKKKKKYRKYKKNKKKKAHAVRWK